MKCEKNKCNLLRFLTGEMSCSVFKKTNIYKNSPEIQKTIEDNKCNITGKLVNTICEISQKHLEEFSNTLPKLINYEQANDINGFKNIIAQNWQSLLACRAICRFIIKGLRNGHNTDINILGISFIINEYDNAKHCCNFNQEQIKIDFPEVNIALEKQKQTLENYPGTTTLLKYGTNIIKEKKHIEENLIFIKKNTKKRISKKNSPFLLTLRRFNSFAPAAGINKSIVGGGYYLWTGTRGVVIDPGFNFLKNYFTSGLSIENIDEIIVSHAHPDHIADLPGLLTLLFEYNELQSVNQRKKIKLYLSKSSLLYISGMLNYNSDYYQVHIMEAGQSIKSLDKKLTYFVLPVNHNDCIGKDLGVGLLLDYSNKHTLLYTSDTSFDKSLAAQYEKIIKNKKIDLLLCHLGGFNKNELGTFFFGHSQNWHYPNHLGVLGIARLAGIIQPKLILIGEVGYELNGKQSEIFSFLSQDIKTKCIYLDLGATIKIFEHKPKIYGYDQTGKKLWINLNAAQTKDMDSNTIYCKNNVDTSKFDRRKSYQLKNAERGWLEIIPDNILNH
ncbi:MAG: MBL fold metallo-hydrolase [Phycisphaerae bacterium]|nr:MBL fold metallo-hydrolase [Phycisphaerae bacterium]